MWDEARLLGAAEELVDREAEAQRHPGEGPLDIAEAQANLHQYQEMMLNEVHHRAAHRAPQIGATRRDFLVMEATERIRRREECTHPNWRLVGVGGQMQRGAGQRCDICRLTLRKWLLECANCRTRCCFRCRRNRLG